jgi:hypothetical protein
VEHKSLRAVKILHFLRVFSSLKFSEMQKCEKDVRKSCEYQFSLCVDEMKKGNFLPIERFFVTFLRRFFVTFEGSFASFFYDIFQKLTRKNIFPI